MSEYQKLGGSLKLKGGAAGPANKKKKKSKSSASLKARQDTAEGSGGEGGKDNAAGDSPPPPPSVGPSSGKTDAERRFEEVQRKRLLEKAAKAAAKTHKERVAEFNEKLETLSEHYDIPKVGPG